MQKTANQIKSSFETLASGHYQIHSFLYAQEFEQQAYENLIYPLMLVYPLGGSLSGTTYSRNYRVIIADRVLKSEGNELEVESDTQLIALDVLAYWMKLGQNERFTITSSNTITPFWEKWGDEVTGHFVDIGIEEFYDFNSCAIPLSGSIPTPPNPCKDARISVNSVVYGNAPSDSNFNVVVKDQDGDLVGSLIGGEWIVNTTGGTCPNSSYTIEDTLGNILYTGTIVSGGNLTQAIGNSTLNVNNSAGTLISSESILAEGTDSYNVADSVAVIKDSAGTTLKTENILATASENISINDSVAVIKDSANLTLKSENILAEATENIVINDSLVNVRKSDNALINAVSVKAENTENYLVADSTITNAAISPTYSQLVKATEGLILPTQEIQNNGVASGFIPSVGTINVTTNSVPTSFTITGRTIDIVVPSGISMIADFTSDKVIAEPFESIAFTDLTNNTPTNWSWRFGDNTNSILQNPNKNYKVGGLYNVSLLAGKIDAGDFLTKSNYIQINNTYFTDIFGIPTSAFSLRKLSPNGTYSGAAIRVRRSSDNTEQDINFASSGANALIDTSALLSFVGSGNGFVVTWYNQNGSANHATNATASEQPRIVNAGVVEMENDYPCIFFNGSNQLNLPLISSSTEMTIISLSKHNQSSAAKSIIGVGLNNGYALVIENQYNLFYRGVADQRSANNATGNQAIIFAYTKSSTNQQLYANNVLFQNITPPAMLTPTTSARIGAYDTTISRYNGVQQELILFASNQLSNRTSFQNNINNYYNVF